MIIDGLGGGGFTCHTLRMRRNYRSPFPVYAASIGTHVQMVCEGWSENYPKQDELEGAFGFKIAHACTRDSRGLSAIINDSHPGNHWCYTVSRFLSPQEAFRQVQFLRRDDVLWVRFCEEDGFFDYEQLAGFTYHPMDGGGVPALIDKYIKGQDYSVVVIEGLPPSAMPGMPPRGWRTRRNGTEDVAGAARTLPVCQPGKCLSVLRAETWHFRGR